MCARGMPRSSATRPRSSRAGPGRPLGQQRVAAPERVLLPADRPAERACTGVIVERQVLAVQRVAHLGAQRVAGAEPGGRAAERLGPASSSASHSAPASSQRRAAARSRARRCSRCGRPRTGRPCHSRRRVGHVVEVARAARARSSSVRRARPLHGEHAERRVLVDRPRRPRARPPRAGARPRRCWRRSGTRNTSSSPRR